MARDASRVEAFSDAVIAIVLTLMAVELLQFGPDAPDDKGLPAALGHEWRAYLAYVITFAVVGQVWLTHHNMWRYVCRVDQMLLVFNLLLLMFVAAIPFTANLLADYLRGTAGEQRLTAALYVGTVLGEAFFFNLSWWWARRRGLLHPDLDPRLARAVARRFRLGPLLYLVAFAVVFVDPILSLLAYLLLVGLYVIRGPGDLPRAGQEAASP
ncbi:TMEM175 family protein [Micromonospora sp. WMMD1128]|uniref:TMEM175 family protein n=1 Tax=unclassified Micromonospora TaxID=2617518 RepID=UPI00248D3662|nr:MULTISPECIES: TMEM175 family protein [unclassified Micromonospora]WBB77131.1 TMEM175 family protein [Micromonospora sp. WMMD1128]WFE36586.1 TMEM175 family protein [Micromonospora sp. WMMD975]